VLNRKVLVRQKKIVETADGKFGDGTDNSPSLKGRQFKANKVLDFA